MQWDKKNYKREPLYGDIRQGQRERTLKRFRDGDINILVATDVAARGLDIPNVDLIIHYELPPTSENFVHRLGRTGRAGKKGTAITIYTMDQESAVRDIERDVGCKFKELPPVASDGTGMVMGLGASSRSGEHGKFSFNRSGFEKLISGLPGGSRDSGIGSFGSYGATGSSGSNSFGRPVSGRPSSNSFGDFGRTDKSSGPGCNQNREFGSFGDLF